VPPRPTLGGKQFWGCVRVVGGWRIQRRVHSDRHRLLDERDFLHATGSREECEAALAQAQAGGKARKQSERLCLMVHGHGRSKDSFKPLLSEMRAAGYDAFGVNYPGSQATADELIAQVRELMLDFWDQYEHIDIVTRSLGALLVRGAIHDDEWGRVHRLVMLGAPNHGAYFADWFMKGPMAPLYRATSGPVGQTLGRGPESLAARVGIPACEFGILSGGRNNARGFNPIIPGDDDGIVEVESTKLEGMKDFIVLPVFHAAMIASSECRRQVRHFLEHGRFDHGASTPHAP